MIYRILALFLITLSNLYSAGFKGDISFTEAEKASHARHVDQIVQTSRDYLAKTWSDHLAFYRKNGFSKYYGDRSKRLNSVSKRRVALSKLGVSPNRESELVPTSCIGLTLQALKAGFKAADDPNLTTA